MTSPILNEGFYTGAFLTREDVGFLSRDTGNLANPTGSDALYPGGLVCSLNPNFPATATAAPLGTNTGNGTFGQIMVALPATPGAYVLNLESPTAFIVESPAGVEIGHGVVGTAFAAGGLSFTLTAGGTAFAPGDSFTITVGAGDGSYVPFTGTAPAVAILFNRIAVQAGGRRKVTMIARRAEVNGAELQWDPTVASNAAAQAIALIQLSAFGIVARPTAPTAG